MNTFKERLSRYGDACREVSLLAGHLRYLKEGGDASGTRIRKIHTRLKLARAARRAAKIHAEEIISRVPEKLNMREIMRMRYIDLMRWKDISECLDLEQRWVLRLHKRALDTLTGDAQ